MTTGEHIANEELIHELNPEAKLIVSPFLRRQMCEDFAEVQDAETRSHVTKLLRSYYTPVTSNRERYVLDEIETELPRPQHIGSQFGRHLQPAFLADTPETGLERFRTLQGCTDDQQELLSSNDRQFEDIWYRVDGFFKKQRDKLDAAVSARFTTDSRNGHENRSAFRNNDLYQFKGTETARSLAGVLYNGLEVSVDPDGILILKQAEYERDQQQAPLTELVKNWPILSISGFGGSKLSLAVHDTIDHVWTFDLAEKRGLFKKYEQFFRSIGDPHQTDMFKREGEILASISFGCRYWERQPGFEPLFNTSFIAEQLARMATTGGLYERHERAVSIIERMVPGTEEYDRLGFVWSNYLVTLHEQRRRYGQIKQRDVESNELLGELNPLSADFLCFLIELHHEIGAADKERNTAIENVHSTLEEYLQSVAQNRSDPNIPLVLRPSSVTDGLPVADVSWLKKHHQFSTIKERVRS